MKATAPRRADFHGSGADSPLPARPLLTTPPRLQPPDVARQQRQRLAAQPWLGLGGLLLTAVVFFALALGTGSAATALLILGPISAFALPAVAMIAFWWNDWPGSRLSVPWTGLIDTALIIVAAIVLAVAGQAIVERPDVRAVFATAPGPATFPATLPLAGAAFTAMLQLSLPCERWPLGGIGRLWSGVAALALSWAIGIGAYFLFVNLDAVPAAERAAAGLRNPGGPVAGAGLRLRAYRRRGLAGAVLHRPARLARQRHRPAAAAPDRRQHPRHRPRRAYLPAAARHCGLAAGRHRRRLRVRYRRRPRRRHALRRLARHPAFARQGRLLTLLLTALVAVALDRALAAYANGVTWTRATPEDWVTTAALSFLGPGIISHVAVGLRWPFALKTK